MLSKVRLFFEETILGYFWYIIKPVSKNKDLARREYILNVLLFSSIILTFVALVITFRGDYLINESRAGNSSAMIFYVLLTYIILLLLSKSGFSKIVSFVMLYVYFVLVSYSIFTWGTDMPAGLLMYSLLIVMSGILIGSKFSIFTTVLICAILLVFTYLNNRGFIVFESAWKNYPVMSIDTIIFCVIFIIITTVSWLFNIESEKALKRARASELALKKERDTLEVKVEKKTRELKQAQVEKISQIYHFAEFGKLASGFMHDLSNSVNLISINLKELEKTNTNGVFTEVKGLIDRSQIGTKRLESFILAARKQINNQNVNHVFTLNKEIEQVLYILDYKAKESGVKLKFNQTLAVKTFGNSIKFYQLVENLISNAIDSYKNSDKVEKIVEIYLQQNKKNIILQIRDFGKGIPRKDLAHIFEPLFTTKKFEDGTGMGLSISNEIVEKNFKGKITVNTKLKHGTTFTVKFPQNYKNK